MQNNRWGIALYDEVYINKKDANGHSEACTSCDADM